MPYARNQAATAQTDAQLVPAPDAASQIVVLSLFTATAIANTSTFESGTAALRWEIYRALLESDFQADPNGLFRCSPGASLTYTTTGIGNAFVSVNYEVRAVGTG
jgi:hypothetical protein